MKRKKHLEFEWLDDSMIYFDDNPLPLSLFLDEKSKIVPFDNN